MHPGDWVGLLILPMNLPGKLCVNDTFRCENILIISFLKTSCTSVCLTFPCTFQLVPKIEIFQVLHKPKSGLEHLTVS